MNKELLEKTINDVGSAIKAFREKQDSFEKKYDGLTGQEIKALQGLITEQSEKMQKLEASIQADKLFKTEGDDEIGKSEFKKFLSTKGLAGELEIVNKDYSGATGAGGALIRPGVINYISKRLFVENPFRALCGVMPLGQRSVPIPVQDGTSTAEWVDEGDTRNDATTATSNTIDFRAWGLSTTQPVTQEFLEDAIDPEDYIMGIVATTLARAECTAFLTGNGTKKPNGLLKYSTNWATAGTYEFGKIEQVASGSAGVISADDIINLEASLGEQYDANASYIMKKATYYNLLGKKDSTGQYLLGLGIDDKTGTTGRLLRGRKVTLIPDMPTVASNNLAVAFGDFSMAYLIGDRTGINILRDPYTSSGKVKFKVTKRVAGDVVNFDAVKFLKIS